MPSTNIKNRHQVAARQLRGSRHGYWCEATKHRIMTAIALMAIFFMTSGRTMGQNVDSVQHDENFVTASIIVADPGRILYERVGHIGLHMQCPEHDLDLVFSYESEDVSHKVLSFLAGNLRMGMFAISADEYIDQYKKDGRGVREYRLNLPIKVKQELWRVLDNHLLEGPNLPYDYITYGCAHSALMMIKEALDTIPIDYGRWPDRFYDLSRRELTAQYMADSSPWSWCFLYLISNGSINSDCSLEDKLIMPFDLIEVLQQARVNGRPLLDSKAHVLLEGKPVADEAFITPLGVSLILLLLTIVCLFFRKNWMDYVLLAIQSVLGIITVYLIFFSSLCCTEWSWLIVPFNPLPLLMWKWRKQWCLPYAVIIGIWALVMLLWPHALTGGAYIVIAIALILSYINIYLRNKKQK